MGGEKLDKLAEGEVDGGGEERREGGGGRERAG